MLVFEPKLKYSSGWGFLRKIIKQISWSTTNFDEGQDIALTVVHTVEVLRIYVSILSRRRLIIVTSLNIIQRIYKCIFWKIQYMPITFVSIRIF